MDGFLVVVEVVNIPGALVGYSEDLPDRLIFPLSFVGGVFRCDVGHISYTSFLDRYTVLGNGWAAVV